MARAEAVNVSLPTAVLLRLLQSGHLGALDLRCLDCDSLTCLRRLRLDICKVRCRRCGGMATACCAEARHEATG
jgi:hypothetical protein